MAPFDEKRPGEIIFLQEGKEKELISAVDAIKQIIEAVKSAAIAIDFEAEDEDGLYELYNYKKIEDKMLVPDYLRGWTMSTEAVDWQNEFEIYINFLTDGSVDNPLFTSGFALSYASKKESVAGMLHVNFNSEKNGWVKKYDNLEEFNRVNDEMQNILTQFGFSESETDISESEALTIIQELALFFKNKLEQSSGIN